MESLLKSNNYRGILKNFFYLIFVEFILYGNKFQKLQHFFFDPFFIKIQPILKFVEPNFCNVWKFCPELINVGNGIRGHPERISDFWVGG